AGCLSSLRGDTSRLGRAVGLGLLPSGQLLSSAPAAGGGAGGLQLGLSATAAITGVGLARRLHLLSAPPVRASHHVVAVGRCSWQLPGYIERCAPHQLS